MKFLLSFFIYPSLIWASCFKSFNNLKNSHLEGLNNSISEEKLFERIQKIENSSNFLRNLKFDKKPAITLKVNKKISFWDTLLFDGNYSELTRQWRPIYRNIEFSYYSAKIYKDILKEIDKGKKLSEISGIPENLLKELKSLESNNQNIKIIIQARINKYLTALGNNYYEYSRIRYHLDELIKGEACSKICKDNIKRLNESLGISSEKEQIRFKNIFQSKTRPTLEELKLFIAENPRSTFVMLKKERNLEIIDVITSFFLQPSVMSKMLNKFMRVPGIHQVRLVRLFRMFYDLQARKLYFPSINRLIRSTKATSEKLSLLKQLNDSFDKDELIITFARRSDTQSVDEWNRLLEFSKTNDYEMLQKMSKAKVKARQRGSISLVYKRSPLNKLATLMVVGGGFGYFYISKDEVEIEPIENDVIIDSDDSQLPIQVDDDVDALLDQLEEDVSKNGDLIVEDSDTFIDQLENKRTPQSILKKYPFLAQ